MGKFLITTFVLLFVGIYGLPHAESCKSLAQPTESFIFCDLFLCLEPHAKQSVVVVRRERQKERKKVKGFSLRDGEMCFSTVFGEH